MCIGDLYIVKYTAVPWEDRGVVAWFHVLHVEGERMLCGPLFGVFLTMDSSYHWPDNQLLVDY